ncbi:Protein FAM100A [Cricetulus griseus]|uniref:Protein FAM100A n=1 Tax=Cricetulus griseus TaxID=10029 RepID=G3H3T3_CRIGR|nr:Protein FAM100A [Cricetulus griseus]
MSVNLEELKHQVIMLSAGCQPPLWTRAPSSPASDWLPLAPQQATSEPRAHPAKEAKR